MAGGNLYERLVVLHAKRHSFYCWMEIRGYKPIYTQKGRRRRKQHGPVGLNTLEVHLGIAPKSWVGPQNIRASETTEEYWSDMDEDIVTGRTGRAVYIDSTRAVTFSYTHTRLIPQTFAICLCLYIIPVHGSIETAPTLALPPTSTTHEHSWNTCTHIYAHSHGITYKYTLWM